MREWIDVNDRLPTRTQDVLAYNRYGCTVGHYDHMARAWRDENDDLMEFEVTHWMPLPAPPAPKKSRKPEFRNCHDCEHWQTGGNTDGTIVRVCINPRSDKFTDTTSADDGCTPRKRAKEDWI